MEHFFRDVRLGFHVLRTNAGFTAVAILTLALGIGVSTALFSVVYGVWLNGYPYGRAGEILYARAKGTSGEFADSQNGVFQQREFLEFVRVPAVANSAAYTLGRSVTVVGDHGPELVPAFYVSAHTFGFLGVAPILGRPIQPSDIRSGGDAEHVAVLSFNLWRRMFHSDPDAVGRTIMLSGAPHVIIGVMPRRFGWGSNSVPTNDGMYLPLATTDADARVRAWVRLRDGISPGVATQQFHAIFSELAKQPGSFPETAFVTDLRQFVGGTGETARYVTEMRASLRLLLFAVGFLGAAISLASGVLFGMAPAIHGAHANLNATLKDTGVDLAAQFASGRLQPRFNMALFGGLAAIALALSGAGIFALLSYQVAGRRREIGIRLALGAGRGRILSMILGSGAQLIGIGLALGVAAGLAISRLVKSQIFTVPQTDSVALIVAVAILAAVAAAACYLPARRACRVNPLTVLRSD